MSDDPQDLAEAFHDDVLGDDDDVINYEYPGDDYPPDRPRGLPFSDADVTDESFAERTAQEEPDVTE